METVYYAENWGIVYEYVPGNYRTNVGFEKNNLNFSFASAQEINFASNILIQESNISKEKQYYRITVSPKYPIVSIEAPDFAEVTVYDSAGNIIAKSGDDSWELPQGNYYISLNSTTDEIINSFSVKKSNFVVTEKTSFDNPYVIENLAITKSVTVVDNGAEYFKFTLDAGESILIAAQNTDAEAFNNIGIELYDENQKLIFRGTNYLLKNDLESGTYYARIQDNTSNKEEQSSFNIALTTVDTDSQYNGKVLLNTLWRQDYPYNMYCPIVNNVRCVTGCGSTAVSQVAYYWIKRGYLNSLYLYLDESNSYESCDPYSIDPTGYNSSQYYEISDSEAAAAAAGYLPFDKVNEIIAAGNIKSTEFIAALCFSVGVYYKALFGTRGTMTFDVNMGNEAALTVQNYYNSTFGGQDMPPETSAIPVDELIADLLAGYPVLATTAPVTDIIAASHVIVIDGYNSRNDTFHINFGWGGRADGWYRRQVLADCLSYTKYVPAEYLAVEATDCIEAEYLQISFDDFKSVLNISAPNDMNGVVLYNYSNGDYIVDQAETSTCLKSVINAHVPKIATGKIDACLDVMFAKPFETWNNLFYAQHHGFVGEWDGTGDMVKLSGKNKICDVFVGSNDYTELFLTDGSNGDALFVDDIFSDSYLKIGNLDSRLSYIDEIYAGAGDDIVDMTSQRFAYAGDGVKIYGGLGNDTIWANNGNNTLLGDAGDDRIIGGKDDDIIIGGIDNDVMHGGGGKDTFCFGENWGNDIVEQLDGGRVMLWFESGNGSWDKETLTYTDGVNSVRVIGVTQDDITLKFGGDEPVAGAFAAAASEKIFEDKNSGMLA